MRIFIMAAALLTGVGIASVAVPASAAPVGPSQVLSAGTGMTDQVGTRRSRPHGMRKIPKKKGL